ncbi:ABC transporter ATP-binding protein [Dolichospermum sp. ST_sed1]|nr:ABC transporter ATP-binding protein [Dolichospermum sp. ST_sed1]
MKKKLLDVQNVAVSFTTEKGTFRAVDDVSFSVSEGQTLAIVGESGCGKSVTALAVMGLLPEMGRVEQGSILFEGEELTKKSIHEIRSMRGNKMGMIFQEPMTALNPVYTVGQQVAEVFRIHQNMNQKDAHEAALEMLKKVRIPDPNKRIDEYPFQMSGGMRQRVLIAISLACNPKLLIADEPTTALDVTIQAQILELMRDLQKDLGTAIILITHDLGVVAEMADDIAVMYAGKIVEKGTVFDVFDRPTHPYTHALMNSIPKITDEKGAKLTTIKGLVPSIHLRPKGCGFFNRCEKVLPQCEHTPIALSTLTATHNAACHLLAKGGK